MEEYMDRLLRLVEEHAKRIDNLNKRLVFALAACVCTGLIVIGIICSFVPWIYFTADYYYPTIETTDSSNTINTIGGE